MEAKYVSLYYVKVWNWNLYLFLRYKQKHWKFWLNGGSSSLLWLWLMFSSNSRSKRESAYNIGRFYRRISLQYRLILQTSSGNQALIPLYRLIRNKRFFLYDFNRQNLVTEISDGGGKTFATAAFGRNFLLQPSSCPCTPSGSRFRCFTCGFTAAVANLSYKVLSVTYFCVRSSHTMGLKRERISPSYGMIGRRMGWITNIVSAAKYTK